MEGGYLGDPKILRGTRMDRVVVPLIFKWWFSGIQKFSEVHLRLNLEGNSQRESLIKTPLTTNSWKNSNQIEWNRQQV